DGHLRRCVQPPGDFGPKAYDDRESSKLCFRGNLATGENTGHFRSCRLNGRVSAARTKKRGDMLGERINSLLWLAFVSCFYIVSESYFSLVLLLTTLVLFALLGAIVFVSKNSVRFEVESPGAVDKH